MKRDVLEKKIQADIEADIGAEDDLLVLKNSVGKAHHFNTEGKEYVVPYGLGVGSPDIVSMLRVDIGCARPVAIWVCFEVKAPEGSVDPEQEKCHAIWRSFGALVYVVRSVADAQEALARARRLES